MKNLWILLIGALAIISACKETPPDPVDLPTLSIEGASVDEGVASGVVNFTISLSKASEETVSVAYRTRDIDAEAGEDYESTEGVADFAPGTMEVIVSVSILDEDIRELDEQFTMVLENPVNAELANSNAQAILVNDDINFNFPGKDSPISYPGMTLVWQDEFDGNELDTDTWTYEIGRGAGGWGNNELQYYREENTSVESGNLIIEARNEVFGGANYTSSRLITMDKQEFQYGRIDIRAVLPEGQGIWPALWMLGGNFSEVGWPFCGEIDIMELVGGEETDDEVHGTVHWDNNGSYANYGQGYENPNGKFSSAYHVFSIVWDEDFIRWYVDDEEYNVIDIRPDGLDEFRQEFFFIFNVAVGGNWPGSPDNTTVFPQQMIVDYVRVFQVE